MTEQQTRDVVIVGGGLAGISAAIYLGRALRNTLVVDAEKSMARWEPHVQNYLGFPKGIAGEELVRRGREQAERYQADIVQDEVVEVGREAGGAFAVKGRRATYFGKRLLLATGIFHVPPDIEGVNECLGHSMFFCKDCDGYRVQGKSVAIYGANNEAVHYALAMLAYTPAVAVVTAGHPIHWDEQHAVWLREHQIRVFAEPIARVKYHGNQMDAVEFQNGVSLGVEVLFTTRGDVIYNELARRLGARLDASGEVEVDADQRTSIPGLYAAGCITPANCQMIIAAGQGAIAGQAINRDLLDESLANHSLRRLRERQVQTETAAPPVTTCAPA